MTPDAHSRPAARGRWAPADRSATTPRAATGIGGPGLRALLAGLGAAVTLAWPAAASADGGSFSSSDPLLGHIWAASVQTASDMVAPGPLLTDAEGHPCPISLPTVLLDGVTHDRCPYVGDQAVTGLTLLISNPTVAAPLLGNMILWYAQHQHPDGLIPSTPDEVVPNTYFDYNAYWVEDLYDYVLYTGDLSLARQVWPNLLELMDTWYPAQLGDAGLVVNNLGVGDYAFIPRTGTTVAYYNAGYVLALRLAAKLAGWVGQPDAGAAWTARIAPLSVAFGEAFWDSSVGAYRDSTEGPVVHPEDGNVFAVLAGLASPQQARSALDYLGGHEWQYYGATIADNDVWDGYPWGDYADLRVYPFMSYFDVVARYRSGLDHSALALIEREWGYMLAHGPRTTMWETIGAFGGQPLGPEPSYDHGWSSGAAPALTSYTLGLQPGSPGFGSFLAEPHPAGLRSAEGTVPTVHGTIAFSWSQNGRTFTARVASPVPGTIVLPAAGRATLDGSRLPPQRRTTRVEVAKGTHTVVVREG